MRLRRLLPLVAVALVFCGPSTTARQIPRLTDQEFAGLVQSASEQSGRFPIDNFVSNERNYEAVLQPLTARARAGGVYIGVGPEQNFTFINAIHPSLSFILDIRRQNFVEHLFYKVAFEASPTRADFLAYLFSRQRPERLDEATDATTLFRAYLNVHGSKSLLESHEKAAIAELHARFGAMFADDDEGSLKYVFQTFYDSGPLVTYIGDVRAPRAGSATFARAWPTLATLMTAVDERGRQRSYLATEATYRYVKDLEANNLIVPVVGDFGGPRALRAIGAYVASRHLTVSAFYLSNVEQYLFQGGPWRQFYDSCDTLPLDDASTFIRLWAPAIDTYAPERLSPMKAFLRAYRDGEIRSFQDLGRLSR